MKSKDHFLKGVLWSLVFSHAAILLFLALFSISEHISFPQAVSSTIKYGEIQYITAKYALFVNLIPFFLLLNRKQYKAAYGVMFVVFIWVAFIILRYNL